MTTASAAASRDMEEPQPGPQLARPKILIVDDRRENLVATRKILRRLDADIVEVSSGSRPDASALGIRY
jgi:PleD family two-component response regulator